MLVTCVTSIVTCVTRANSYKIIYYETWAIGKTYKLIE